MLCYLFFEIFFFMFVYYVLIKIDINICYGCLNWLNLGEVCFRVIDVGIEVVVRFCKDFRSLNISGCKVCCFLLSFEFYLVNYFLFNFL